jgi:hypothetical protein
MCGVIIAGGLAAVRDDCGHLFPPPEGYFSRSEMLC